MMTETVVTVQEVPQNNASKPDNQANNSLSWLKLNVNYFKTIPGILKLVQLILGILCMALSSPAFWSAIHFFLFVSTTSFIITMIWVFVYFLGIREALKLPINWLLTELVNTTIITFLYLIAFIIQLATVSGYYGIGKYVAAGVFGLFNTIAYGAGAFYLYMEWKQSQAQ